MVSIAGGAAVVAFMGLTAGLVIRITFECTVLVIYIEVPHMKVLFVTKFDFLRPFRLWRGFREDLEAIVPRPRGPVFGKLFCANHIRARVEAGKKIPRVWL